MILNPEIDSDSWPLTLPGKLTVSDLDDDQIRHLSDYVDGILEPLRKYADTGITMETKGNLIYTSASVLHKEAELLLMA